MLQLSSVGPDCSFPLWAAILCAVVGGILLLMTIIIAVVLLLKAFSKPSSIGYELLNNDQI